MKTAMVIGATGLVGSQLISLLFDDPLFDKVIVFTRRSTGRQHQKLEERIIDFNSPAQWREEVKGDVLFSTLGTTLRTAGSKEAQYLIDYTYQYRFAEAAAKNSVPDYVLVSSAGSSPDSVIFYSRMKGQLERDVKKLSFQHISLIRPGQLAGNRKEKRSGEKISIAVLRAVSSIPGLGLLKPIDAALVAKAMINAYKRPSGRVNEYTLKQVFLLAAG